MSQCHGRQGCLVQYHVQHVRKPVCHAAQHRPRASDHLRLDVGYLYYAFVRRFYNQMIQTARPKDLLRP